eukprot:scaffold25307_cov109-Isochrysis_galbana.AAC.14
MVGEPTPLSRAPLTHTSCPPAVEPLDGLMESMRADSDSSKKRSFVGASAPAISSERSLPATARAATPPAGGPTRQIAEPAVAPMTTHSATGSEVDEVWLRSKMRKAAKSPNPVPFTWSSVPPAALSAEESAAASSNTTTDCTPATIVTSTSVPFTARA